jgi:hypothetical protein
VPAVWDKSLGASALVNSLGARDTLGRMVQIHRGAVVAGVVAGAALLLGSCSERACTNRGCLFTGLNVRFGGGFELGKRYEVEISIVTPTPEVILVMRCALTPASATDYGLACTSAYLHAEQGDSIRFFQELSTLLVSVSADGDMLYERTHEVEYTIEEINGPGCGTCEFAVVDVEL